MRVSEILLVGGSSSYNHFDTSERWSIQLKFNVVRVPQFNVNSGIWLFRPGDASDLALVQFHSCRADRLKRPRWSADLKRKRRPKRPVVLKIHFPRPSFPCVRGCMEDYRCDLPVEVGQNPPRCYSIGCQFVHPSSLQCDC